MKKSAIMYVIAESYSRNIAETFLKRSNHFSEHDVKIYIFVGIIFVLCELLYIFFAKDLLPEELMTDWPEKLMAVCSVITAIILIWTIRASSKQFKEQQKMLRHQNFESSFFQLLGMYDNVVESLKCHKLVGRGLFEVIWRDFGSLYREFLKEKKYYSHDFLASGGRIETSGRPVELDDNTRRILIEGWHTTDSGKCAMIEYINGVYERVFFRWYHSYITQYLGSLYSVVKFVHDCNFLDREAKERYINIIRSHLSSYELGLLFYHCLSKREKRFKCLIEKYTLFKNMDFELFIGNNFEHHVLYDKSAYGDRLDEVKKIYNSNQWII